MGNKRLILPVAATALAALTALTARAAEEETWKKLGGGLFSDPLMSNMYQSMFDNSPVSVLIEESEQTPGRYRINCPWGRQINGIHYLVIDATDPELVLIPAQPTPLIDEVDGETWVASLSQIAMGEWGCTREQFLEEQEYYNITMRDGVIKFPAGCGMFMWPDAKSGYSEPGEWMVSNDEFSGYLCLPGAEPPKEWRSLGTGRLCDGFLTTFMTGNPEPRYVDVEVMEHVEYEGYYRIVKPFAHTWPEAGDMLIDMGRPDFGYMEVQDTGIEYKNMGNALMLSASANGLYPTLADFIAAGHGDQNITMEEGRISIPAGAVLFYFPEYSTTAVFKNDYAADSFIELPGHVGASEIASGEADGAEYFNLQGQRVERPAAGELVIVRRGGKAEKRIAR